MLSLALGKKRPREIADEAATVLPVKVLAFPVSLAMHYNKANESLWKERRREVVSYKGRDRHPKNLSMKSVGLSRKATGKLADTY